MSVQKSDHTLQVIKQIASKDAGLGKLLQADVKKQDAAGLAKHIATGLGEKGVSKWGEHATPKQRQQLGQELAASMPLPETSIGEPKHAEHKPTLLSNKSAFETIAKTSGTFPKGHDYSYDIASVLQTQAPGHAKNTNPSAAQYTSFAYAYNQYNGKGKASNPALAHWMHAKLSKVFPHKPGAWPLSTGLDQLTSLARRANQKLSPTTTGSTAEDQIYGSTQNNLQAAFDVSGYSSRGNVPNNSINAYQPDGPPPYAISALGTKNLQASFAANLGTFTPEPPLTAQKP